MSRKQVCLALLVAVIAWGCASGDPAGAEGPEQRRERLRETLRAELGVAYDEPLPAATIDEIREGAKLYDRLCKSCHGNTGRGDGATAVMLRAQPPDLSDPATAAFFPDRAKLKIIAHGIEGTPMIGWDRLLDDRQQTDIVHFMNTLVKARP